MEGRNGGRKKKVILFDKGRRSRAAHLAHLIVHAKPTVMNMIRSLGKLLQQKNGATDMKNPTLSCAATY
jgi:hypothetical protein